MSLNRLTSVPLFLRFTTTMKKQPGNWFGFINKTKFLKQVCGVLGVTKKSIRLIISIYLLLNSVPSTCS